MNPLRRFIAYLRDDLTAPSHRQIVTARDVAPVTPPTPVLSCLVQGLIRSIQQETAQWEDSSVGDSYWRHTTTGFSIREGHTWGSACGKPRDLYLYATNHALAVKATDDEGIALHAAIDECIIKPQQAEADRQAEARRAEEALKAVPIVARFEALGCGPQTMPNPEATPAKVASTARRFRKGRKAS